MSNDKKSSDPLQNFGTFFGAAALIGTLTAGVNHPPEQPKGNDAVEKEVPTSSRTSRNIQNTAAALAGGGITVSALARLRKRNEKQKENQNNGGRGEGRSV